MSEPTVEHLTCSVVSEAINRLLAASQVPGITDLPPQHVKCAGCVNDFLTVSMDIKNGILHDGKEPTLPELNDAVTWLPNWQTQNMGGQVVVGVISLPTCLKHAGYKEETPAERATRSGLIIGGKEN